CLDRADARLPRCRPAAPIESWTLVKPTSGADMEGLLAAAAHLGPSSAAGTTLTFSPPLDASARCTDPVAIVVPTHGRRPGVRVLRARTPGVGVHPRDLDALEPVFVPWRPCARAGRRSRA